MDRGARQAIVQRVTQGRTQLKQLSTHPSQSSWDPSWLRGAFVDSMSGRHVSCLRRPPVSALVLLGKLEQTQRTGHPDLLGQQTRVWGLALGEPPSSGRCPRGTPTSQVQGPSPAQLCSLSFSLPVPDLVGAQGDSGVPFWFILPPCVVLRSSHDTLFAGGSGQVA